MRGHYANGLEVLGDGLDLGMFVPWLGVVSKALGGATGATGGAAPAATTTMAPGALPGAPAASTQQVVQQMLEQERAKQAFAKVEADAVRTRLLMYGLLGVVGAGVVVWVVKK